MDTFATNLIATLGGSTAVSRLTAAPVSTVQSWKHNGIPQSRLAHLRLIAEKEAIAVDWDTGLAVGEAAPASPSHQDESPALALSATKFDENIRSGEGGHGHPFPQTAASPSTCSRTSSPPEGGVPPSPAPSIPAFSRTGAPAPGFEGEPA